MQPLAPYNVANLWHSSLCNFDASPLSRLKPTSPLQESHGQINGSAIEQTPQTEVVPAMFPYYIRFLEPPQSRLHLTSTLCPSPFCHSLVTYAAEKKVLHYDVLLEDLQVPPFCQICYLFCLFTPPYPVVMKNKINTVRELEDLIIEAICANLLQGKLNQKLRQFQVCNLSGIEFCLKAWTSFSL